MEAESSVRFGQGVPADGSVHPGSGDQAVIPGTGMIPVMGSLQLAGVGIATPVGMVLPGGALTSAGYGGAVPGLLRTVWNGVAMARQLPRAGGGNAQRAPPPQKGPWTAEEDDILKDMVRKYGDRKWAAIAQYLPGRIGKQCRERWTNHLRPDIKKGIWTEEDDTALIEAHKSYGNRWSVIARFLPGRSENAVKNHWNATKRSLKAKRRLKKKNAQAPPGQWSVLEEYIRSLYPPAADPAAPAAPAAPAVSPPSSYGYGEVVSPPAAAAPAGFDPAGTMGMYFNAGNSSAAPSGAVGPMNPNVPLPLHLNACYYGEHLRAMAAVKPQMMGQHQQPSYANLIFVDNLVWRQPTSAQGNANASGADAGRYLYGEAAAGPSSAEGSGTGPDDVDVVQMASRQFLTPSEDEVTLDLARFM